MQLKKIQELFVDSVRSQTHSVELVGMIDPGGSLTRKEALGVYALDYKARMQEALGKNYEATWLVLGDDEFLAYAEEYISTYPSDLTNLTTYGDFFPDLLSLKEVVLEVVQMAIFERDFWKCFHAPSSTLLAITAEMLEFSHFNLSVIHIFESEMRLDRIWQNRELGSEALGEVEIYELCHLVLFKAGDKVDVKKLSQDAYELLGKLKEEGRIILLPKKEYDPSVWAEIIAVLKFSTLF